jgi:CheY-like chemotaxis protein
MQNSQPILLIGADRVDVLTVKRTLEDLKVTNILVHKAGGNEALEYLKNKGNKKPCVILLDLNMPKMSGIEFLKIIKADDDLKKIPVVVLTTSKREQNVIESFKLGVAGYMVKPADYKKFVETVRKINLCWTLSGPPKGR